MKPESAGLLLVVVLCTLLVAGCVEARTYSVSGSFNGEVTDEQVSELSQQIRSQGGWMIVPDIGGPPPGFTAEGLPGEEECLAVRAIAQQADYVTRVGDCTVEG